MRYAIFAAALLMAACSSFDDQDKKQMVDNVAVAETYYRRAVVVDLPEGYTGLQFSPNFRGEDVHTYLSLNLRAWVAWAIKVGAIEKAEGVRILAENGIKSELGGDE